MKNKPRLCLALYARPKHPGTYDYALLVCPKKLGFTADKFYVKNAVKIINGAVSHTWAYEAAKIEDLLQEHHLLARIVIAKVLEIQRVDGVLRRVPLYPAQRNGDEDGSEVATCVTWVHLALAKLRDAGVVSHLQPWDAIRGRAVFYVEQKKMTGRWDEESAKPPMPSVPTLDLLQPQPNPEVMP